jgi:dTDP-glucose pyrophosphorylase/CBS domain-containing protein
MKTVTDLFVNCETSIRDVMSCIDRNKKGIVLVVDSEYKLVDTITDGDIRRAILADVNLKLPIQTLLDRRTHSLYRTPLTAPVTTPVSELMRMMNESSLRHIPLLDEKGRVVDIAMLNDLVKEFELPLTAVVMAGGHGKRMLPLTEKVPKPMLPVGDRPLLERMIEQLRKAGIRRVNLTTHYKGEMIAEHFGDGKKFGVDIRYVQENEPLGTAGALGLVKTTDEPLLVVNGDLLTQVNFSAMLDFHRENQADMTVAVRQYEFRVPFGVVETEGVKITHIEEKPLLRHFINAGIYLLNPGLCQYIQNGQNCDMTDLIARIIQEGRRVVSFPIREYWLDVGKEEDYLQAQTDAQNGEV